MPRQLTRNEPQRKLVDRKRLGAGIRRLRDARGLNTFRLAVEAELDLATVSRLLVGRYSPSLDTLFALAEALNMKPGEFLDEAYKEG